MLHDVKKVNSSVQGGTSLHNARYNNTVTAQRSSQYMYTYVQL